MVPTLQQAFLAQASLETATTRNVVTGVPGIEPSDADRGPLPRALCGAELKYGGVQWLSI